MNYYPFHVGDYLAHTAHLEPMEDLAYRRLLDAYYLGDGPLIGSPDQIARRIRLRGHESIVAQVLSEFFDGDESAWSHKRCDTEIAKYQAMREGGRNGAAKRWPKGVDRGAIGGLSLTYSPPNSNQNQNQNQEPEKDQDQEQMRPAVADAPASKPEAKAKQGTRLPADWSPSPAMAAWAANERPDLDIPRTADRFRDYWLAKPGADGRKLDWDATWRNWVRNESGVRAGGRPGPAAGAAGIVPRNLPELT